MALTLKIVAICQLKTLDGVLVRQWIGVSEKGTECTVHVRAIRVETEADNGEFKLELIEFLPMVIDSAD